MKTSLVLTVLLGFWPTGVLVGQPELPTRPTESRSAEGWICPPCGDAHDDQVFPEGGACPICGMTLQALGAGAFPAKPAVRIAILLFDGVQIIDYTGPYEVFGQADFEVFTVSESGQAITTTMGMTVVPSHSFATVPRSDVVLVPGGRVNAVQTNRKALEWLKSAAQEADYVLSVCNGAFILGHAGLLDGHVATTFHKSLDDLEVEFPEAEVVRDRRYTDNGKILTSAGLSSGIDASLHLVSKIKGELVAKSLALHLEYEWDPDHGFVRGRLADRHLPELRLGLPADTTIEQTSSIGNRDHWEVRFAISTERSSTEIVRFFREAAATVEGWTFDDARVAPGRASWKVQTAEDGPWRLDLMIDPNPLAGGLSGVVTLERFDDSTS